MNMNAPLMSGIIGISCGVISAFGIGGGSILMVWLTAVAGVEQTAAQGINLLFFLPTAGAALIFHIKRKCVCWNAVIPAIIFGCVTAAAFATLAANIDVTLLRKLFGGFLLIIGVTEILKKNGKDQK